MYHLLNQLHVVNAHKNVPDYFVEQSFQGPDDKMVLEMFVVEAVVGHGAGSEVDFDTALAYEKLDVEICLVEGKTAFEVVGWWKKALFVLVVSAAVVRTRSTPLVFPICFHQLHCCGNTCTHQVQCVLSSHI